MLCAQTFSIICLFLWGLLATYPIIWFVDKVTPVRLSPLDEIKGCDLVEHYMGEESDFPLSAAQIAQIESLKLNGIPQVTLHMSASPSYKEFDANLVRRKPYQVNGGFEDSHQQTTERL